MVNRSMSDHAQKTSVVLGILGAAFGLSSVAAFINALKTHQALKSYQQTHKFPDGYKQLHRQLENAINHHDSHQITSELTRSEDTTFDMGIVTLLLTIICIGGLIYLSSTDTHAPLIP